MAELTEMPFGVQIRVGPMNPVLDGSTYRRHLVNRIKRYVLGINAGCHKHYCSKLLTLQLANPRHALNPAGQ